MPNISMKSKAISNNEPKNNIHICVLGAIKEVKAILLLSLPH